jgi:hypothetical protein
MQPRRTAQAQRDALIAALRAAGARVTVNVDGSAEVAAPRGREDDVHAILVRYGIVQVGND